MPLNKDELIRLLYFIWLSILTVCYAPLILYYCKQLWNLNDKIPSFHKRYPKYVIIYSLSILFHMLILRTIADAPRIMGFLFFNDYDKNTLVRLSLYNTIHGVYIMALTRSWLLYVEYTRGNHLMRLSWIQLIDAKIDNIKMPWTLKYPLLSNIKFLTIIGFIYWIIIDFSIGYAWSVHSDYQDYVNNAFYIILSVFFLFFVYSIRICRDEFFIHLELRYIGIVFVIMIPMTFILFVKFEKNVLAIIFTIFVDICMIMISLISTKYVIYKYDKQNQMNINVNLSDYEDIKIEYILENKDGFDLFANHLVKEFSIEHLIFLFEIMQLKYEVIDNRLLQYKDNNNNDIDIGIMFKCGDFYMKKIKRNKLHFEIKNHVNFYEKLVFILYNYIVSDAEYSINISAKIRMKILSKTKDIMLKYNYMMRTDSVLQKTLNKTPIISTKMITIGTSSINTNVENEEILKIDTQQQQKMINYLKLIDEAIENVIRLLSSDSYHRFIQTKSFENLIKSNPNLQTKK